MNKVVDGVYVGVFIIAFLLLISSTVMAARSFNSSTDNSVISIAATPKKDEREKEIKVLGITNIPNACLTKGEYVKAVEKVRPEVELHFGTEVQHISSKQILSCVSNVMEVSQSDGCIEYQVELATSCVENLFDSSVQFTNPEENIRSNENGKTVASRISDEVIDFKRLSEQLVDIYQKNTAFKVVTSNYATVKPLVIVVPTIKDLPNTDGEIAARYIEFDGSRQLMFIWEKGKYKKVKMSGAFPEYNPVGVFSIINKSPLAWSSTANKWMPYWQAFTYDKKQRAMLGIHALDYWYDGFEKTGTRKIYEPVSNIGKPRSTGCLRLTIQDARSFFEWSKVGDLVIVHN